MPIKFRCPLAVSLLFNLALFTEPIPAASAAPAEPSQCSLPINAAISDSKPFSLEAEAVSAWSLPIAGPLRAGAPVASARQIEPPGKPDELSGSISASDASQYDAVSSHIDRLLESALARDPQVDVIEQAVKHYRTKTQVAVAEGKDAANYVVPYRGFGPSIEAGDVILGENVKLKSKAAAEYARQKYIDEAHLRVVSDMMQIAMGLGMTDQERGKQIVAAGMASLKEMVGDEEAERTRAMLMSMAKDVPIPAHILEKPTWDVKQKQAMQRKVMELALDDDPVVHQIVKQVHKYNHRSKLARVSSQVVQTLLGTASLTPSFIGPAAKTALLAYVMSTGGPEQCKLLKELYLDKRMESRYKVLNEETHMALDNYQLAILTKNPSLLVFSESIVGQMVGDHQVADVFGECVLSQANSSSGSASTAL